MTTWKIQGSRVYGNGQSYNCINKVTAESLLNTLNTYEKTITTYKEIEKKLDKITKQIIQLQRTTSTLSNELTQLKEVIQP